MFMEIYFYLFFVFSMVPSTLSFSNHTIIDYSCLRYFDMFLYLWNGRIHDTTHFVVKFCYVHFSL